MSMGSVFGIILFLFWRLVKRYCISSNKPSNKSSKSDADSIKDITIFSSVIKNTEDLTFLQNNHLHPTSQSQLTSPLLTIIGRGGCGEVYKADVISGGHAIPVAIKVIELSTATNYWRRMRQVRSEITTIGRTRHPNLLRLLAHVAQPGRQYLVYEYMKNGSLHDALSRRTPPLPWPQRHAIAVGVAAGLDYLHRVHRPKIVHRDLKPANILLDSELRARIGDFGLAKAVPDTSGRLGISSGVLAGTVGYIAPEYYQTLRCTDKCDVYSFGVILAVLATGKSPTDRFLETTEEMSLMGWVRGLLSSENPAAAIDAELRGGGYEEEILLVLKIAHFCTYQDPAQRPSSRDVYSMLSQIRSSLS